MHEHKGCIKILGMFKVPRSLLLCTNLWDCILVYVHIKDTNKALTGKAVLLTSCKCLQKFQLTFTARASYRLGRHLNTSALRQDRASHTLGQPQPQPFKYFALNIFREISLILCPRSFSSFMLRLIYQLRENNMYPFFIWGCLYTATKVVFPTLHSLFFLLHSVGWWMTYWIVWSTWPHSIWVIAIWRQATINRSLYNGPMCFFYTSGWAAGSMLKREIVSLPVTTWSCVSVCVIVKWASLAKGKDSYSTLK
jgi:hypothetical protein